MSLKIGGSPAEIVMPEQHSNNAAQDKDDKNQSQKRKRVTRACDECRKKKVKCDGQQPCIHCTVYSYDCTYDQPSNRKKSIADIHLIEQKLKTAEQVLVLLVPNLDIFDQDFKVDELSAMISKFKLKNGVNLDGLTEEYNKQHVDLFKRSSESPLSQGKSSKSTSSTLEKPLKLFTQSQFTKLKRQKLNYPHPNIDGSIESQDGKEIKIILPPKSVALELVTKTWASPCVLFRFYHRTSFIKDLDELYSTDPEKFTNKQQRFLPLAYSVMAVGALFSKKNGIDDNFLEDEGFRYFVAARKLIDITDARDLYAIQTIVMLILFLQCSARLSTCYSYIGVALRSALREGLHRKVAHPFNPIEIETRKRLFWTIYKMDIYVNTMLGLPRSISPQDIDQDLPKELDDENITENGYLPQQTGKLSSAGIANQHTSLIMVLNNIVKNLYPINTDVKVISHEKVSEMELELRSWLSNLPKELIPGYDPPYQYYRANRLLHLSFLHVQIVLYRPFIHYVSPKYTTQPNVDQLSIQRAKNCISVARTVVSLAEDMINYEMLSGSYWFSIYTIFFSVACLVYYVHEVPFDEFHPDYIGIRHDAEKGKEILTLLKDSSMAASRIYSVLNQLFEQLNRRTASLHEKRQRQLEKERKIEQEKENKQRRQEQQVQQVQQAQRLNDLSRTFEVPIPQNLTVNDEATQYPGRFTEVSSPYRSIKLEDKIGDFDHLANFDNFINQPSQPNQQPFQSPATVAASIANVPQKKAEEKDYMPGIMDQLDMQIFGRFLPPYMLKRPNGTTGPGANGTELPSGLNSTNNLASLDDLTNLTFSTIENNGTDASPTFATHNSNLDNLESWPEFDADDFNKYL